MRTSFDLTAVVECNYVYSGKNTSSVIYISGGNIVRFTSLCCMVYFEIFIFYLVLFQNVLKPPPQKKGYVSHMIYILVIHFLYIREYLF